MGHSSKIDARSQGDIGKERRRLVAVWERLLENVWKLPKFEHFLKPMPFSQLSQAAPAGRIIVINASEQSVDALIIDPIHPVKHVPLPDTDVEELADLSWNIYTNRPQNGTLSQRQRYISTYLKPALRLVWTNILTPIFKQMEIGLVDTPGTSSRHRIWWYPTGPLIFIPIHAAGPGSGNVEARKLVISPYVTTLSSLSQAQRKALSFRKEGRKLLAVSQPNTPGQCPLPRSTDEVKSVVKTVSEAGWFKEDIIHLDGPDATVDKVSNALSTCSWAHFACHGLQDPIFGFQSALALHNGTLHLSTLASKHLTSAQFVFLSVCQAATGVRHLPGEAAHLAGGLQFAGFASVVATMWSISDEDAPKVAGEMYRCIFEEVGGGDPAGAA